MWFVYSARQDSWYDMNDKGNGELTITLPATRYGPFESSNKAIQYAVGRQFGCWVHSKEND